ncbi:hypothetical protein [Piscinibacter sp. XHJ-5]|uniref:hypothetical protein n=1 Tax=Piscinibacter sp. XHJ-5 TaxID=3037797 RepID=UPI002452A619|nr:hypothetical protein [Piscinibacter sp. XHJ-5]
MNASLIHCHTGRRRLAVLAGWRNAAARFVATVLVAVVSAACVGGLETAAPLAVQRSAPPVASDTAYFPSQFAPPAGDIEPLPPQF